MVARRRHTRHLAEEFLARCEIVAIPVTVITLAADEVTVHERDIAVEIADEILHVRPVLASITVNIADGEDTISRACLRSGLGPTDFRITTGSILSDGKIVACIRLQARERNDMDITFFRYVPSGIGGYLLVQVGRIGSVINESFSGLCLIVHLPQHFHRIGGRRH